MNTKNTLLELCSIMSVTGHEYKFRYKLRELLKPYFTEAYTDNACNNVFVKKCGKPEPQKLLIDVHFDEIGFIVKGYEKGFLRISSIGGIDARILPGSVLTVYGEETFDAVVTVMPPSLRKPEEAGTLVPVNETLLDTGYLQFKAEELAPIGTPVGFKVKFTDLMGNKVAGKSFDDKACAVCVLRAMEMLKRTSLNCDIYFSFSSREEVGHNGSDCAAYSIEPDACLVLDVTVGFAPEGKQPDHIKLGEGPSVSISAALDRELTKEILETAKKNELKCKSVVEATSTGTNADTIPIVKSGIPTALINLPILFMHTANEVVSLDDIESTASLLAAVIKKKYGGRK